MREGYRGWSALRDWLSVILVQRAGVAGRLI
jgi:hypothetical protein